MTHQRYQQKVKHSVSSLSSKKVLQGKKMKERKALAGRPSNPSQVAGAYSLSTLTLFQIHFTSRTGWEKNLCGIEFLGLRFLTG